MKTMKTKILSLFLVITIIMSLSSLALAADSTTQIVTFEVQAVNDISVSGDPGPLVTIAGSSATDNSTTYSITTNEANKKITGELDADMPPNTTLEINLAAPTGASSLGDVALSSAPADLVTGIGILSESGLAITYTFTADVGAGVIASDTRTVTLTITD
jgi:opacity protein-like surface antigen